MRAICLLLALVLVAPPALGVDGVSVTTVWREGDAVPGVPGATILGIEGGPSIGDNGTVIGPVRLQGPGLGSGSDKGVLVRDASGLTLLALEGWAVPGAPGYIYRGASINLALASEYSVARDGTILVVPSTLNTGTGAFGLQAVVVGTAAGVSTTLFEGSPPPGFPQNFIYEQPAGVRINSLHAVMGRMFGGPSAIWVGFPGAMTVALETGLQAPGLPIGVNLQTLGDGSLRVNDSGEILFRASLPLGNGVTQTNRNLIYMGPFNNVGVLARTGEPVPGTVGAVFTGFEDDTLCMNGIGAACFGARVSGGGTDEVIITGGFGTFSTLVRDGDPLPGAPGVTLDRVTRDRVSMNGLGRVAFGCRLAGATADSDSAILIGDPLGYELILREGDPLPGGGVAPDLENAVWAINDRDQFVIELPAEGKVGLYATRPDGELLLLVRTLEAFATDDGLSGVVTGIGQNFSAGSSDSGGPSYFNSTGQIAVSLGFSNGDGGAVVFDVDQPCEADLAAPYGVIDGADLAAARDAVVAGGPEGDFDGNGVTDFFDLAHYQNTLSTPCP